MTHLKQGAISAAITAGVILLLLVVGPAQAFNLNVSIPDDIIIFGNEITITASAEVESDEQLSINNFTLEFDGPEKRMCIFSPNGSAISGCEGINIAPIQSPDFSFGYGYGYGYFEQGFFIFNISLNSSSLLPGKYNVKLIGNVGEDSMESDKQAITILKPISDVKACSVRARNGILNFEQTTRDGKNKLNLNSPLNNARNGKGTFLSQEKGNRINYDFDVIRAQRANNGFVIFDVRGELKENRESKPLMNAKILFDTNNMEAHVISQSLNAKSMEVTFSKC